MKIRILITMILLCSSFSAVGDEPPMSAREIAETRLLAEWVEVPEKQFVLGNIYYKGDGVPKDLAEARKWFQRAADQGHTQSQYMLGAMHDRGEATPSNYIEAAAWYLKSAEGGYVLAQFELGKKYAMGKGVPQNYAEAYIWFSLAAASGLEDAVIERDRLASNLSKEEISEAQRRSTQLFEKIYFEKPEG